MLMTPVNITIKVQGILSILKKIEVIATPKKTILDLETEDMKSIIKIMKFYSYNKIQRFTFT